ncbi:hypothetical protein [Arthrobacter sp. JSM 101049]|uniref:hypothetical protein n=1 Tax=Arthrobacter sp. JSM 101049 TaxID=929097 RepID=UPI003563991B
MFQVNGEVILVIVITAVVLLVVFGALSWVFTTRPARASEAEQYIARLNDAAARQQQLDAQKAEKLRAATTARAAQAARRSPGRTGQSSSTGHPGATPGPGAMSNPDYEKVLQLVRDGHPVAAVRKIRHDTGIGLLEAKRYVDSLRGR